MSYCTEELVWIYLWCWTYSLGMQVGVLSVYQHYSYLYIYWRYCSVSCCNFLWLLEITNQYKRYQCVGELQMVGILILYQLMGIIQGILLQVFNSHSIMCPYMYTSTQLFLGLLVTNLREWIVLYSVTFSRGGVGSFAWYSVLDSVSYLCIGNLYVSFTSGLINTRDTRQRNYIKARQPSRKR